MDEVTILDFAPELYGEHLATGFNFTGAAQATVS